MEASRYNSGPTKVNSLLRGPGAESSMSEVTAPKVLEDLARHAERVGASDVHLHLRNGVAHVAFRLDGLVTPVSEIPSPVAERVFGRIKFLAKLKTYQDSLPQDGRIDKADLGTRGDVRVATYPTVTGEKIVLRLFSDAPAPALRELNLPDAARAQLESFLRQPSGLLLLTGPAGSGKTTTIYACLRHLTETGTRHIITIEDPVEQILPGIMQTEINEARGLTFAKAARHLLRQDPQVLVLGEIRDEETANLAVRAALTGHLVISTLHAGSCRGVVERLQVMCADRSAVASVLGLVLNQRLVRRLCESCRGEGCEECLRTGYKGRLPVVEWVRFDAAKAASAPMQDAARELVAQRLTDEAEVRRIFPP